MKWVCYISLAHKLKSGNGENLTAPQMFVLIVFIEVWIDFFGSRSEFQGKISYLRNNNCHFTAFQVDANGLASTQDEKRNETNLLRILYSKAAALKIQFNDGWMDILKPIRFEWAN